MTHNRHAYVTVIGGGVVGLSVAYALTLAGHQVTVLEAGTVGGGASGGNAGWITPTLATPLAAPGVLRTGLRYALDPKGPLVIRPGVDPRWLWRFARATRRYQTGADTLLALARRSIEELDAMRENGVRFEEHRAGLLIVARSERGLHGFDPTLERLDGDVARRIEPLLGGEVRAALHATVDRHVDPLSFVHGLRDWLLAHGAEIREHTPVDRLPSVGDVVVAAGAATPKLVRVPVIGAKGYSVTLPVPGPSLPLYLAESKIAVTPLEAGLRLAGFLELGARDERPNARRIRQLVEDTRRYLDVPQAEGIGWAGLRPITPDGLPIVERVSPRVIVATGHGMLGVTLAPVTGRLVCDLLGAGR